MAKARSIQGEKAKTATLVNVVCRAFKHVFDGHVFQENVNGKTVWVARLECQNGCETKRIDVMKPRSFELLYRSYEHGKSYDGKLTQAKARKLVMEHMASNGVSLSSLLD